MYLSSYTWSSDFVKARVDTAAPPPEVVQKRQQQRHEALSARRLRLSNLRIELDVTRDPAFLSSLLHLEAAGIVPRYSTREAAKGAEEDEEEKKLDFHGGHFPFSTTPRGGHLPSSRCWRKEVQVKNMLRFAMDVLRELLQLQDNSKKVLVVVEFCAGSGFLTLPLAVLFPTVSFVLIDNKPKSIEIARQRILDAGLTNVRVLQGGIEDFGEPLDLGLALHACGSLSDTVLDLCLAAQSAFVICPCCVGKITRKEPRSRAFCDVLMANAATDTRVKHAFTSLVKASDFAHSSELALYSRKDKLRRVAKSFLEHDRELFAREHKAGYRTALVLMQPFSASPKNDMLIGWPSSSSSSSSFVQYVQTTNLEQYLFQQQQEQQQHVNGKHVNGKEEEEESI